MLERFSNRKKDDRERFWSPVWSSEMRETRSYDLQLCLSNRTISQLTSDIPLFPVRQQMINNGKASAKLKIKRKWTKFSEQNYGKWRIENRRGYRTARVSVYSWMDFIPRHVVASSGRSSQRKEGTHRASFWFRRTERGAHSSPLRRGDARYIKTYATNSRPRRLWIF